MNRIVPLPPEALYRPCDPSQFTFATTADLPELTEVIGQERAVAAVRFGVTIQRDGYNLFALGPNGTGKFTAVNQFISQKAAAEPVPPDWCYVFNFKQPHKPQALQLPPGRGMRLAEEMDKLVEGLFTVLPAALESESYHRQRKSIEEEYRQKQERVLEELTHKAKERNIALISTPMGMAFAPLREKEVISPDDFIKLPPEEQKRVEADVQALQDELQRIIRQAPQWKRELQAKLRQLNEEVARVTVAPLFDEVRQGYDTLPNVLAYLEAVQRDVIENADYFLASEAAGDEEQASPRARPSLTRYQVNVLVNRNGSSGAPVIYEDHPTHPNLIGRVEYRSHMGVLMTDFTLIKPGALHQANGGYLLLDARKVLLQAYAWEGLKLALRAHHITIESLGQILGWSSTASLEPEPIPLNVKVVLLGERLLYYLLCAYDPDFDELFKVVVDFDDEMVRDPASNLLYARLIGSLARKEQLRHFDQRAVARVAEQSARLAGDAERLSMHMQSVADLLREADYWAGQANRDVVTAADVQQAIDAQLHRAGRLRERMQEVTLRGTVLIDTDGAQVGQVNGLSVIDLGRYAFGRPSRITARVRLGKGEVVDIERQVELGGPIHSKGVLILASFLASRYAADRPLSISASLVFEQSYSGVEGDSASSAELYALLSALSGVPLQQSLAVTGSVNQYGQVQAIGGVNEKIEGFFDLCQARGLTGAQGVLIPAANVKNLMLRADVVQAARDGHFHIYAVETIDQGIEILTGLPAGEADEHGRYPEGSLNHGVAARLAEMAEKVRAFSHPGEDKEA
jgi:lon-related putative ATP-dependent protease